MGYWKEDNVFVDGDTEVSFMAHFAGKPGSSLDEFSPVDKLAVLAIKGDEERGRAIAKEIFCLYLSARYFEWRGKLRGPPKSD